MKGKKIILGVTVGGSSKLLEGQVSYMRNLGCQVFLMSPNHPKEIAFCEREGCTHIPISINRNISPFQDLKTLFQLVKEIRRIKPDLVNFGTPKMGLLGILAARISGVKNRIYTCRGLRYETVLGFKRKILMSMERLTALNAKKVIYVSPSLREKALSDQVAFLQKSIVLGKGSSNGVNLDYFSRARVDEAKRTSFIQENRLSNQFVIGFIGRITEDKGIEDLVQAFELVESTTKDVRLLLVGHYECSDELKSKLVAHPAIVTFPFTDDVPLFLSVFDVLVLPSYREGFPNVPIQAASMGVPVVTTDATGCKDSVQDGYNGFIYPKKEVEKLSKCLLNYAESKDLLALHAANSLNWARNFSNEIIWKEQDKLYQSMMK